MRNTVFFLTLLGTISSGAQAFDLKSWANSDQYQADVNLGYQNIHNSNVTPDNLNTYKAGFTAYAAPVNTAGLPLAEAAYLQKASYATLGYQHTEHTGMDFLALDGKYYICKEFYATTGLSYLVSDKNDYTPDIKGALTGQVGLGIAPVKGLEAGLNYAFATYDGWGVRRDVGWGGSARYVHQLNAKHAFRVNGAIQQGLGDLRNDMSYDLGAAFFFNPTWDIGLQLNYFEPDTQFAPQSHSYGLATTKFIGKKFWFRLSATHTKEDDYTSPFAYTTSAPSIGSSTVSGDDYNTYTATLGLRF